MPYDEIPAAFDAVDRRLDEATRRAEAVVNACSRGSQHTYSRTTLDSLIQLRNDLEALRAVVLKRDPITRDALRAAVLKQEHEAALAKGGGDE